MSHKLSAKFRAVMAAARKLEAEVKNAFLHAADWLDARGEHRAAALLREAYPAGPGDDDDGDED